ncbi:VOC family protein [Flavihumibacter petaseus]|uniref:PhnB-like domain-containing protein n=1 Tax=Flavihumibacter petaseus NBRC 106054 TaxID=1220578 RepID=A0A0E9MZY0_9BACT|nr:VOC family protein [Flavihumibacter petaseus]GAO43124.1 hypothetical protein FPE01S_02_02280 [Flavihumibacter petaseus NBRC 106054]
MISTNPYLHFDGNAEAAMTFYKRVLGGSFTIFSRYKDMQGSEKLSADDQQRFVHISLAVREGVVIMATDSLSSMGQKIVTGNNYHIHVQAETGAEADRIFEQLAEGGKVEMPMNMTFWGAYFGMCQDKFGVYWMINFSEQR